MPLNFAKSVTNLPKTQKPVFRAGKKNRVTYSTQPNIQTTKNIEVTSSTTKREVIEVTQINTQKARLAQIELLNKLNKCKNPFIIITQEPYCYKATLALMPQNAKTIPTIRTGHPRASITASNRLHMEELSELGHRDLVAGLVTLEGKKTVILSVYLDITQEVIAEHLVKAI